MSPVIHQALSTCMCFVQQCKDQLDGSSSFKDFCVFRGGRHILDRSFFMEDQSSCLFESSLSKKLELNGKEYFMKG